MTPLTILLFCEENLQNVWEGNGKIFADCPKCGKGKKHFDINTKTGLFHCYKCGFSGGFPWLVKYITGSYPNLDKLEEQYVSELSLESLQEIFTKSTGITQNTEMPDWTENTCRIITKGRLPRQAREYLLNRNVSVELADELQFRVGVSERYVGRILMPVIENGEIQNFVARSFTNNQKRYDGPHKDEPYINKSKLLWNYDAIKYNSEIVVTEGIFDAISLMKQYPTVALMGKVISDIQVEKLLNKAKSVVILMDGGFEKSAKKIARKLIGFIPIKIAVMEKGDPSDSPELAVRAVETAVDYYEL